MHVSAIRIGLLLLVLVSGCAPSVTPAPSVAITPGPTAAVTSSPTAPPAPTPAATTALVLGSDGLPTMLDGQPVYRPSGASGVTLDDTPFLVGGWTRFQGLSCPSAASSTPPTPVQAAALALLWSGCPAGTVLADIPHGADLWWQLRNPAGLIFPDPGAIVVRVHTHDPAARNCPPESFANCDGAIVIEAVLWDRPGPLPSPSVGPIAATMSVGDFVAAAKAGTLPDGEIELHGYWSFRHVGHSCAAPTEPTGDLEYYCSDGEFGITERNEPILTYLPGGITGGGRAVRASGPAMTPFLSNTQFLALAYFGPDLPYGGYNQATGLWPLPIPITVVGHVGDPRAADCRPSARQLCRDRLVVDAIVEYDPASVPPPSPSPVPTPFPSPPPPALFGKSACYDGVPESFAGWAPLNTLDIGDERTTYVFARVTRDAVPLSDARADPARNGHSYRVWGRGVCWSDQPDVILFDRVTGSVFKLYDDGVRVPVE
jgi:hypothetical protein